MWRGHDGGVRGGAPVRVNMAAPCINMDHLLTCILIPGDRVYERLVCFYNFLVFGCMEPLNGVMWMRDLVGVGSKTMMRGRFVAPGCRHTMPN